MAAGSYGLTPLLRSFRRTRAELTRTDAERYVDLGIELRVSDQDVEEGVEYLRGKPPLRAVAVHRLGGIWDTRERKFVGESKCPVLWYVGRTQADFLLEVWRNPLSGARTLLISAEGGGKTVLMSQSLWLFVLAVANLGIYGKVLATAPTHARLDTYVHTVSEQAPIDSPYDPTAEAFGTYYTATKTLRSVVGVDVVFRATKKASAATGSPIQGLTVLGSFDDELQDTVENGADPDIEARCRGARHSRRVGTATAKDSSQWRAFRDGKGASPDWAIVRIPYTANPFVWPEHWDRMRRNMSKREWDRRGLALDVGPELMVYTSWDRAKNLKAPPLIGKRDITAQVLGGYHALVGHDPGTLHDVSIVLKCYEVERARCWWVVDEITTDATTTEQHVAELTKRLRGTWQLQHPGADEPKVLVRCDPYGDSDNKTDRSVYTTFKLAGYRCLAAAYNKQGLGTGRIDREARIEMVQRLLCSASGERRLFVDCDERQQPVAPKLVYALELSEREEGTGKAERGRKGANDLTHWPAALGYALWPYERLREVPVGPPREALL